MDPVTIAGLVLGALPLLISAAENYEITFQPFVTYHRHVKEVQRFRARLDAQRAIFRNECQLLLLAVGQNLTDILGDPNHPARSDQQLSKRLEELLGSSFNTCVSTLTLINETLEEVTTETAGFGDLLEKKVRVGPAGFILPPSSVPTILNFIHQQSKGKGPLSRFRQKIKISFSKTRLNEIVDELRLYNSDLSRLSAQIRRLGANSLQNTSNNVGNNVISHLQVTQQASKRLYDVLASRWSCDERIEHVASMDLKVEERCRQSHSKVRFNLGVTCNQITIHSDPLWLSVESAPHDPAADPVAVPQAVALQASLQKLGASGRSVKFAIPSSMKSVSAASSIPQSLGPHLDLCTVEKLCKYVRRLGKQNASEPCIGFLEKTKTFKHFIYQDPGFAGLQGGARSLKEILRFISDEKGEADWIEKLKLARLLSLAVLRFHSTPWLTETWSSNDVCFFGANGLTQEQPTLESPCINAKLSHSQTTLQIVGMQKNASAAGLASNQELFSLGVVLIELGYDSPFETASQLDGLSVGNNGQVRDFLAARRLGETVHKKLNMTYGRLVEKCLNCNFGVATNLADTELQGAVLTNVVNQLDICIEQYRKFNSLAPALGI